MVSRATVRPVRLRVRDDVLQVDVLRGVGYRAVQTGVWAGPFRRVLADARQDARERNAQPAGR